MVRPRVLLLSCALVLKERSKLPLALKTWTQWLLTSLM